MKNLKLKKRSKLFLVFLLVSVLAISCEEDDEAVNEDTTAQFVGTWQVSETTGLNAPQSYEIEIEGTSVNNEVLINGLYNVPNVSLYADISGFDISIPAQQSAGISFTGSGEATVDFDQITINFTANDGSGNDQVSALLWR